MSGVFRPVSPLPIQIELRKLHDHVRERYLEYGRRRFGTIITFANVISSHEMADMCSQCYKVADPRDSSVTIDVVAFKGKLSHLDLILGLKLRIVRIEAPVGRFWWIAPIGGGSPVYEGLRSSSQPVVYEEETLLFIGAKLAMIKNKLSLQAFKLREVTNIGEYEAFCRESILAWDYHTKTSYAESKTPISSIPRPSLSSVTSSPSTPLSSNKRPFNRVFSSGSEPAVKKPPVTPNPPVLLKRHDSFDDDVF